MGICAKHVMQEQWEYYRPERTNVNKCPNLSFNGKVKQSLHRLGQALTDPGGSGSQSFQILGT